MAVIDRIKYDGPEGQAPWLVYKFPSEELVMGSQLIVNKSQEAIFFKGGNALDVFGPGTHTLATANLPFLNKLVNLPFGGKTPFSAEVFFINKASKLDMTWGTTDRFPVTEPRYGIIVNVGAFGQFGIKIADARNFTTQIVGALHGGDVSDHGIVSRYFKGLVVSRVKAAIADMIVRENVSLLEISALLDKASAVCFEKISGEFDRFGLEVVNFKDVVSVATKTDSVTQQIPGMGTVQMNSAESFVLTTSGGTSLSVLLRDQTLIDKMGGGQIPNTRAEMAIQTVRKMLREKKSA